MNEADRQALLEQFKNGETCPDCRGIHMMACPRIKRKCFHPNGNVIEVEYWPLSEYRDHVVWLDDVFEDDQEDGDGNATGPVRE
jgi:phenylpropionate dioxygenase-like ring-hydroxylating dioxygenase large terminal subunit